MKSLLSAIIILLAIQVKAQEPAAKLLITVNENILQPGDSLDVSVRYDGGTNEPDNIPLATVELLIENEAGQRTRLRWPMLNNLASGSIYLPKTLARGRYTLYAALQERFFEVVGEVKNEKALTTIQAMLLTKTGDWDEQRITVGSNGRFNISNWLFEDNALLAFNRGGKNDKPMDIKISSQLDSSYQPLAVAGRGFYVGNPPAGTRPDFDKAVETPASFFADKGDLLPAVIVKSTIKTPAQQYDEKYVQGLFRSMDERTISIMDQPNALGFPNVLSYLQGRVAGLQISSGQGARWRGGPVTFFVDEIRTSAQQVASIPMQDIAIVKAFPPPFMGALNGGGGVAIYTRRGGEASFFPPNRQVFKVRGYTPASIALDMDKMRL